MALRAFSVNYIQKIAFDCIVTVVSMQYKMFLSKLSYYWFLTLKKISKQLLILPYETKLLPISFLKTKMEITWHSIHKYAIIKSISCSHKNELLKLMNSIQKQSDK